MAHQKETRDPRRQQVTSLFKKCARPIRPIIFNVPGQNQRTGNAAQDLDLPGCVFAAVTPLAVVSSPFLSRARITIQYSRYIHGNKMVLNGTWHWRRA
jgi:hypothetical protein